MCLSKMLLQCLMLLKNYDELPFALSSAPCALSPEQSSNL
jgi:hypothetical protein